MSANHLPIFGAEALANTDVLVAKIGGDNAGLLRDNFQTVAERSRKGLQQILVVSAIRSSSQAFDAFADPSVVDKSADGRIKHGFNTTSHLIRIAQQFQGADREGQTENLSRRIGNFTRLAIRKNLEGNEEESLVQDLESAVGDVIDRADASSSLLHLLTNANGGRTERLGEDWQLVLPGKDANSRRSITGIGEELAQALYANYFRQKGMQVGQLNIDSEEMLRITHAELQPQEEIQALQQEITRQLEVLLREHDVIIAGGYLPKIGSQRGYSDKTGALLAVAAHQANVGRVTYLIEKAMPIMSSDPGRIAKPKLVKRMTRFLAKELFGNIRGANGTAVHPEAIDLLAAQNIPAVVANPKDDPANATLIQDFVPAANGIEIVATRKVPVAIEIRSAQMIGNPGFIAAVAAFFTGKNISIDQVATSEGSISLTFTTDVPDALLDELRHTLSNKFAEKSDNGEPHQESLQIDVLRNKSLIFCLGNDMKRPGIAAKATLALQMANADVHMMTQGLNECVMVFMIDDGNVSDALSLLHDFCIVLPEGSADALMREMRAKMLSALESMKK